MHNSCLKINIMKTANVLLYVCSILIVFNIISCKEEKKLSELKCSLFSSFTTYPDSTFFKDVSCLSIEENRLYMFDRSRADVAVLDIGGGTFYTVGKLGEGPEEVVSPTGFYVQKDTVYISDDGAMALKLYDRKGFIKSVSVPTCNEFRFFIDNDTVYATTMTDRSCYVKVARNWNRMNGNDIQFCGDVFSMTEYEDMNALRNQRHLVKGKDCLYTICPSYPVVEKYDLHENKLLASYDLSDVDVIKDNLSYIEQKNISSRSFFTYLCDAYWDEGKLYLLCATWEKEYRVNTILILNSDLTPSHICYLPGKIYDTICVDKNYIYTMNYERCAIEIYGIDQPL